MTIKGSVDFSSGV